MRYPQVFFLGSIVMTYGMTSGCATSKHNVQEGVQPFSHALFWETYRLSPEAPTSPSGIYKLKKVRGNGSVVLNFSPVPEISEEFTGTPFSERGKSHNSHDIFVVDSDAAKQTATIMELRAK